MKLKDGTGSGVEAKVTNRFRLCTSAVATTVLDLAAIDGDKFNINTDDITLTDANKTTVLYLKNNEDRDLIITALIYNLGATASGTGDVKIDVIRNPTAGNIISNANNVPVVSNQNFGSSTTLTADVYVGATVESVVTDGDLSISTRSASRTGRIVIALGAMVLPKGSSMAIDYTPPASNTSQICQFAISCFLQTVE